MTSAIKAIDAEKTAACEHNMSLTLLCTAKATAAAAKTVTVAIPKSKPSLKRQVSTLSMHSHRLSLAGRSDTTDGEFEDLEKPYEASMTRILSMNKPEWPFNLIGDELKIICLSCKTS